MNKIDFLVQGSAQDPYQVTFIKRSDTNLSAYCDCPAGINGQYCKHRFNILAGSDSNIVSNNENEVKVVALWLIGSDIETALLKMHEFDRQANQIKKELSLAKKEVARAMRD